MCGTVLFFAQRHTLGGPCLAHHHFLLVGDVVSFAVAPVVGRAAKLDLNKVLLITAKEEEMKHRDSRDEPRNIDALLEAIESES